MGRFKSRYYGKLLKLKLFAVKLKVPIGKEVRQI
ncbi:hypothetical protein BDW_04835 [Bdellovibrio bacteriovorus W]|nr:hypothetical protein BDW_04835 [Bdellovibrio bacteriovorus W]